MSDDSTTFRASLPPIMSAIRAGGDGGVRIQLDVPDSDMAEALRLLLWRDRVLVVTVRSEDAGPNALVDIGDNERADGDGKRTRRHKSTQRLHI